jgi:hypothetical protein
MKTSQSYEREIEKLRLKHTEYFNREEWLKMQTVGRKIRETWDAYHRAKLREGKEGK